METCYEGRRKFQIYILEVSKQFRSFLKALTAFYLNHKVEIDLFLKEFKKRKLHFLNFEVLTFAISLIKSSSFVSKLNVGVTKEATERKKEFVEVARKMAYEDQVGSVQYSSIRSSFQSVSL